MERAVDSSKDHACQERADKKSCQLKYTNTTVTQCICLYAQWRAAASHGFTAFFCLKSEDGLTSTVLKGKQCEEMGGYNHMVAS